MVGVTRTMRPDEVEMRLVGAKEGQQGPPLGQDIVLDSLQHGFRVLDSSVSMLSNSYSIW